MKLAFVRSCPYPEWKLFGKSSPLRNIKPCSSRNDMDALSIALPFGCKITAKIASLEQMPPPDNHCNYRQHAATGFENHCFSDFSLLLSFRKRAMLVSLFQPAYSLLPVIGIFLCTVICIADQETASASFLLWGQRQRHTNTDMGSLDCKSADNSSVKKHQEALCILAGCYHGTTYAHVLRRFYCIHGKSRENLE